MPISHCSIVAILWFEQQAGGYPECIRGIIIPQSAIISHNQKSNASYAAAALLFTDDLAEYCHYMRRGVIWGLDDRFVIVVFCSSNPQRFRKDRRQRRHIITVCVVRPSMSSRRLISVVVAVADVSFLRVNVVHHGCSARRSLSIEAWLLTETTQFSFEKKKSPCLWRWWTVRCTSRCAVLRQQTTDRHTSLLSHERRSRCSAAVPIFWSRAYV
jgi:hypothetical protein